MFTKLAQYILPYIVKIADDTKTDGSTKNVLKSDESKKDTSKADKVLKGIQIAQGIAGTAALGLGTAAITKSLIDASREKKERQKLVEEQLDLYGKQDKDEEEKLDKAAAIDEVLKKAAELEMFSKPKELLEYREYLLSLPYNEAMKKIAQLREEIKQQHLKIGELTEGQESDGQNVDPLTKWLIERALS